MGGEAAANGDHFPVGGRVAVGFAEITSACNHPAIAYDHGAEREIGFAGLIDGQSHEALVVGGPSSRQAKDLPTARQPKPAP